MSTMTVIGRSTTRRHFELQRGSSSSASTMMLNDCHARTQTLTLVSFLAAHS